MPNILEIKRARADLVAKMVEMNQKADFSDDDADEWGRMKAMVDAHDQQIADHEERMKCLEQMSAKAADTDEEKGGGDVDEDPDMEAMGFTPPVRKTLWNTSSLTPAGHSRMTIKQPARKNVPPGTNFATFVIAAGIEKKFGRGAGTAWLKYDHKAYDPGVLKALQSGAQSMGGFTVPQDFVAELIPVLRSDVLVRKIGPRVYPMTEGNLTFPRQSTSVNAVWISETTYANATQLTGDNVQLTAHKLAAVTACTNDLIRRSALVAEAVIRDDMVEQIARAEDLAYLLNTTSGIGVPVGLLGQVASGNIYPATSNTATSYTSLNTAASTTWLQATAGTLQTMELALKTNNVKTDGACFLFNPIVPSFLKTVTDQVGNFVYRDEINSGKIWGYPYHESNLIPSNLGAGGNCSIGFFVQPDEIILGDSLNVSVDSTSEGAYMSAGNLISTFATDSTAFRVLKESDLAMRHPTGVAVAYLPGWAPAGYTAYQNAVSYSTQPLNTTPSSAQSANPTG